MSAATITESSSTLKDQQPTVVEAIEEIAEDTLARELSKKEKQKQKKEQKEKEKKEKEERERERKEKEKKEKERKEREKKEKKEKEKKDKKISNDQDELTSSPTIVVNASETREDEGPPLPPIPIDSSELVQIPVTSPPDSTPTTGETPLQLQGQEPPVTNDSTPAQSRELSSHEEPLVVNTNLPKDPQSLESAIIDATQTSINDTSDSSSTSPSDAKKNWANAIGSVRGFLVRTSNTVVEKINQKLDELDEHLMEQYSDDESYEIEHQERLMQDGLVGEGSQNARSLEQQQREELLGTPNGPPPVPPKDQKYSQIQQETSSTQSVLSETMNALAERGQKLDQLSDKLENMSSASSEFARVAKELAEREANKKWYQIW